MRIIISLLLIIVMMGCTTPPTDNRLSLADSIISEHPDSALNILSKISPSSLSGENNKAYFALLFTQAKYHNDITLSSDSAITTACDYFYNNHKKDSIAIRLYARSLLQKGNTLRDMDNTKDAISVILQSFEFIDSLNPSDYLLFADANYYLANIYAYKYSSDSVYIPLFKKAQKYYALAKSNRQSIKCLNRIGAYYRISNTDSAYKYLQTSMKLALNNNDSTTYFRCIGYLARAFYKQRNYTKSKDYALFTYLNGRKFYPPFESLFDLCKAYARLGKPDSALFYLSKMQLDKSQAENIYKYYEAKELYFISQNRYDSAYYYFNLASKLSDSIVNNQFRHQLFEIDKKYDNEKLLCEKAQLERDFTRMILAYTIIALITTILYSFIFFRFQRKINKSKQFISILKEDITNLSNIHNQRNREFEKISSDYEKLIRKTSTTTGIDIKPIIDGYILKICDLISIDNLSQALNNQPQKFHKMWNNNLSSINIPHEFWQAIRTQANIKYSGEFNRLIEEHHIINDKDINILSMVCLGYAYNIIAMCCGYTNDATIKTKVSRMKKKMQLNTSITEYLNDKIKAL